MSSPRRGPSILLPVLSLPLVVVLASCGPTSPAPYDLSSRSDGGASPTGSGPVGASGPLPSSSSGHVAPGLEALLPTTAGGTRLSTASGTGADIFRDDPWSRQMAAWLAGIGRTPADFRYAQAWDPTGGLSLELEAAQVPGLDASRLRSAIVDATRAGTPDVAVTPSTVGGKPVTAIVYPDDPAMLYLYEHDDVVFLVSSPDESLAATLLGSLP